MVTGEAVECVNAYPEQATRELQPWSGVGRRSDEQGPRSGDVVLSMVRGVIEATVGSTNSTSAPRALTLGERSVADPPGQPAGADRGELTGA